MKKIIVDRRYWLIPVALWTAVVLVSLFWNLALIDRQVSELSASRGREVYRIINAMRMWNARHDGVYVLQGPSAPPNPFVEGMPRELTLADGRRFSLMTPSNMTRQVAAIFYEQTRIRVRVTSLKPINPDNAADDWEAAALHAFEQGAQEQAEVVAGEDGPVARFIAPVVAREPCLSCHTEHRYKVGDIRGGISVSFPSALIGASMRGQVRNVILVHAVGWLLVTVLAVFALARSRQQLLALARGRDELEGLVNQRTAELRQEVAERHQAEDSLRLLVNASGNGIFGLSAGGECTFINPVALALLGARDAGDFLGRPILDLISPAKHVPSPLHDALRLRESLHSDDCAFRRLDGSIFQAEVRLDPIDGERQAGAVVNFSDITRRKAQEASIWRQANYDTLTGLANRGLFRDRLEQALAQARRDGETFALLFIDLDGFKEINDRHGHAAGDWLLQQTARRLQENIRESDVAARPAGDEFLLILRNLESEEMAGIVAAKLIEAIAAPCRFGDAELSVSASVGISLYPADAEGADDLIKYADRAMYRAKGAGKQTWRYYRDAARTQKGAGEAKDSAAPVAG